MNPKIAAIGGGAGAVLVAAAVVLMPSAMLEGLVWTSGVAALVPAAQPPLGITARAVLAIAAGGLAGAVGWSVLYLLVGPGGFLVGRAPASRGADAPPSVRRADAHPDAPPRRPICAADLGAPMMDGLRVEQRLPTNLEQPLAAFDPTAIPAAPRAPSSPVAPLPRPQPDARIETFALPPVVLPSVAPLPVAPLPVAPLPVAPLPVAPLPVAPPPVALAPVAPLPVAPQPVALAPVLMAAPQTLTHPQTQATPRPFAPMRAKPEPVAPPSIDALLRRLEQGARARESLR